MCIGIPMKVIKIDGEMAQVEQAGLTYNVSLVLVEGTALGDYVLVHAGFAITRLDPEEARETLSLLSQAGILPADSPEDQP